jgi:multicomponent Na+:H+ antiporter subunit E
MIRSILLRGLGLCGVWWALTDGRMANWWLGAIGIALAVAASLRVLPAGHRRFNVAALPSFVAYFLWHSMRGGVQVAAFALRPRPNIAPAIVYLTPALPPGGPRLLMLYALALMPGTVGVRMDPSGLTVHVMDAGAPVASEAQSLENHIARLFAVAP